MTSILDYWPEDKFQPRDVQIQALQWIEKQTAKYMILQLPVASGKSHIAVTTSAFLGGGPGNSYVLTPQKVLQKQYDDTFPDDLAYAIYGKNNFKCESKNCTCDIGTLIKPTCDPCGYTAAVSDALQAPNIIMNYKLALLMFSFHPSFSKTTRKLLVVDECHNLEQSLVDFDAATISRRFVEQELKIKWPSHVVDFDAFQQWMNDSGFISKLTELLDNVESQVNALKAAGARSLTPDQVKLIKRMFRYEDMLTQAHTVVGTELSTLNEHSVFDYNEHQFAIRPLYGKDTFHLLQDKAERFLFMSGTVDKEGFCRDLGIPLEEAAFLSLESPIPAENRPVVFIPSIRMNYEWSAAVNEESRKNTISLIEQIIEGYHPNDSGVIHTGNFKIADWVRTHLAPFARKHNIALIDHVPDDDEPVSRDNAIAQYLSLASSGQRAILISPSCTEGLDLKGDLGRFSIVLKVPFGNLVDRWIKRRLEISREWYSRQALYQTLQAAGRVVRDPNDYGVTYIVDSSWVTLYKSSSKLIPPWWKAAYSAG